MLYHAYLEEDVSGICAAHVPDLAGCLAAGATREAALAALPDAVRAYLSWCGAHGDPLPDDGAVEVAVAEVARGYRPWLRGGANALFSVDRAPLGDAELRTYLRRMGYARFDLLALLRLVPPAALDTVPPDGGDTVRQIVTHIADTELWYASRIGHRPTAPGDDIMHRLVDERARVVEAILRLAPRQRDLVYVPTEQRSEDPEEAWTLRKVLRRLLEHELEHLRALQAHAALAPSLSA
ncbi:MAG: type II toxin-antitoxin system HicB family antitoxin [Dehalococcoidia bacterium]